MNLKPSEHLSQRQITKGLDLVVKEGLTAEAMSSLTGGTFLVALAILLGASNVQIGILAALPSFSSIFQLVAVRLLQRYNNRRAIAVFSNICARVPLLVIGILPLVFSKSTSIQILIFLLFFHYFFGSIAGANWNSWMKDLVPEKRLGTYFSHRTRMTQTLNVVLSLTIALSLDYIKRTHPTVQLTTYAYMFIGGGLIGLFGTYLLSKTPEPASYLPKENMLKLFKKPLRDKNYRKLLIFNSFWSFSLNIATPFFTVYMLKNLSLPLSYIIAFGILGQVSGIFAIKLWGRHSDEYSNKTIIKIAAPLYILCILSWPFASMAPSFTFTVLIVAFISVLSGIATSGINLSIGNIGLKLAVRNEAIVYLTAKNMVVNACASLGPVVGGFLADYFAGRTFSWNIEWNGPKGVSVIHLLELHSLGFLFIIGGALAFIALRTLSFVKEEGEVPRALAMPEMRSDFRSELRNRLKKESLLALLHSPVHFQQLVQKKIKMNVENTLKDLRKKRSTLVQKRTA
ncbi:MAG TPA: MFS transporter [Hanamia sp.]|nr:MFS transporter [Hanamia sp.]